MKKLFVWFWKTFIGHSYTYCDYEGPLRTILYIVVRGHKFEILSLKGEYH